MSPGNAVRRQDVTELRAGLRALVRRFSVSERADIVACCGMTVAQGAALEALRAEGPMRLGALGRRLGVAPSTLSRNLTRLQESGAVIRQPEPNDGRASRVALTAAGRRAAERIRSEEGSFARGILRRLAPGRRRPVVRALVELLEAVRAETESCCPGAFDHLMEGFPPGPSPETRCNDE
jgi:DNA-binding MarR family transcriptional regulator